MMTPEELLEFVNEVRRAAGAEELEELLPGERNTPQYCLIAINLNFGCSVRPSARSMGRLFTGDERFKVVAEQFGFTVNVSLPDSRVGFLLPAELNEIAKAFDQGAYYPERQELYTEYTR